MVHLTINLEEVQGINIKVHLKKGAIETIYQTEVSDEILELLEGIDVDANNLPPEIKQDLFRLSSPLSIATRRVLSSIKYNLNQETLDESLFSVKNIFLSKDKINWQTFPGFFTLTMIESTNLYLTDKNATEIQKLLNSKKSVFLP